ncbi:Alpha/Beta hydrolase protein [Scenedesmus sp. NREL 46B-D3]|nr:Alpha/Beta hydrolase protein [Scenedesmus sp. NREL 46B-D3]
MAGQNAVPLARSAVGMAGRTVTPNTNLLRPVQLPKCKQSNVLLKSGGFPSNWQQLGAQQQAQHPINMVMLQLGYAVYQEPSQLPGCLGPMGIDTRSIKFIIARDTPVSKVTALILKAADESIFVVFKGSDLPNAITDLNCRYSAPAGAAFASPASDLRLHDGFYRAWQVLEREVVATVNAHLRQAPKSRVYVLGHSLGAAIAPIAALWLQRGGVLAGGADVAGVWLLAAPRAGNAAWRDAYDAALLTRTLRMSTFRDFAARLPQQTQDCSVGGLAALRTERGEYAHVGRSLLMCPAPSGGLVQWVVAASGTEKLDCGSGKDGPDTSGATHMLGSYFDSWRRGYLASRGSNLAEDARTAAVLCEECADRRLSVSMQLNRMNPAVANPPARAGGPVTCFNNDACRVERAWQAVTAVGKGNIMTAAWSPLAACSGYFCVNLNV